MSDLCLTPTPRRLPGWKVSGMLLLAILAAPNALGASANLKAELEFSPDGTNRLVVIAARNEGPDPAADVSMFCQMPPGSAIVSELPLGCVLDNGGLRCTLNTLDENDAGTRTFVAHLPPGTLSLSVSSSTPDPDATNNCSTLLLGLNQPPTSGRIACESGAPVAHVPVVIAFHDAAGGITSVTNSTDADGRFTVNLACRSSAPFGGQFVVSTTHQGGQQWTLPSSCCCGNLGTLTFSNCLARPGVISGWKYHDRNGNAHRDLDEPGLPGWTILLEPGNLSTITDAYGNYAFSNLTAGTYTLREVEQPDWTQTFPPAPGTHTVTLPSGTGVIGIPFGNWRKCITPPPGLSAWWPLDEPTGATLLVDLIAANHAVPAPFGTVGPGGPLAVPGMVGGAIRFTNAATTLGLVPSVPAVSFGTGDFTIECWIKPTYRGPTEISPIVDKVEPLCPTYFGYSFYVQNGALWLFLADNPGFNTVYGSTIPITYGVWQFVAVTVQRNGFVDFYVQGVPDSGFNICSNPNTLDNPMSLWIGGNRFNNVFGDNDIDELEFFHRALTVPELDSIYNAGRNGKCKRICGTKFNDLNANGVRDFGEPGLPNWKIFAQGPVSASTLTDANGNYCFTNLPAGTYTISEQQQLSWIQTFPPNVHVASLGFNVNISAYDFGNTRRIFKDDWDHHDTGKAQSSLTTNGVLVVTNIGSTGDDGVELTFRPPANFDAWVMTDLPSVTSTGATLRAIWRGAYNAATNQPLGSVTARKDAEDQYNITNSFNPLGATDRTVKLYANGIELPGTPPQPPFITASAWPIGFRARTGPFSLAALFHPDTTVTLAGTDYRADEVRFIATPSGTVNYISGVEVTAGSLDTFSIPAAHGEALRPQLTIELSGPEIVLNWDLPGYQLQSATSLDEPLSATTWNNVTGTPPLRLSAGDPRKFFRLVSLP